MLVGFADVGYLSNPHKYSSQTGYVFIVANTIISWGLTKQMLLATSLNQDNIIMLHEAVHECVCLRPVITHMQEKSGLSTTAGELTCNYEDYAACMEHMNLGYIKRDNMKHIYPKFFYNQHSL